MLELLAEGRTFDIISKFFSEQLDYDLASLIRHQVILHGTKRRTSPAYFDFVYPVWGLLREHAGILSCPADWAPRLETFVQGLLNPTELVSRQTIHGLNTALQRPENWRAPTHYYEMACGPEEFSFAGDTSHVFRISIEEALLLADWGTLLPDLTEPLQRREVFAVPEKGQVVSLALVRRHSESVWGIGVYTRKETRRKGAGTHAVAAATQYVTDQERIASYTCRPTNLPAVRIARKLGYKKFAEVIR